MIEESLHAIQQRMADAMARVGRVDTALLVAVTKNHPVSAVEEVARLGVTHVGENRVQEAKEKQLTYKGPQLTWHLIGHLQVNKPHVRVRGLMCMAPFFDDPQEARPIFRVANALFEDMKRYFEEGQIQYLSMGMTHDFEVALEEGANIVRVGTAIFGERVYY